MKIKLCAIVIASFLFLGCTSVAQLADTMNERHITSCLWITGSYGPFVGVNALMATGGATIEECKALR